MRDWHGPRSGYIVSDSWQPKLKYKKKQKTVFLCMCVSMSVRAPPRLYITMGFLGFTLTNTSRFGHCPRKILLVSAAQ